MSNQGEGNLGNTCDLLNSVCDDIFDGLGNLPIALEATARSRGSMEQGQLQARNPNISSENEIQLLNQDPGSKFGITESNQRKRRRTIKCSFVAAASSCSGLKKTGKAPDYLSNKLKNFKDQLRRIKVKDKEKGLLDALKSAALNVSGSKVSKDEHALTAILNKRSEEWPTQKDVSNIWTCIDNVKKSIEEAEKDGSFNIKEAELQQEVEGIGEAIKTLKKSRDKFHEEFQSTEETSTSNLTARGFLSSDLNAHGHSAQAQGISSSRTGYEDPCEYVEDFLKKLLGKENNKVEFSDFKCLQLKLDNLPISEFNSIDTKLRKLCGKAYVEAAFLANEKLLVLAAIKEMGEESVDESILLKWGAAFNKAEQAGYHVDFAKKRLELIACAFFGSQSHIKEKFNCLQKYVEAAVDVGQMESPTDGMFPSDV